MNSTRLPLPVLAALFVFPFAAAPGQTATAPAPAAAVTKAAVAEDALVLDAFRVKAVKADDYLASEQATGTRYAAQIRDIPFPVSVVTSELMKDFQAWNFDDAVAYTSSFSPTTGTGNFILRGIRQANAGYRNGVRDNGLLGTAFIDRIEIIKGANAAIYGQTEPSGLRNVVTLRPRAGREFTTRLTGGTGTYLRGYISANDASANGRVKARLDAYHERDRQRPSQFADAKVTGVYGAADFAVRPGTSVFLAAERTDSALNDVLSQPILIAPTPGYPSGRPLGVLGVVRTPGFEAFRFINPAGPDSYNKIQSTVIDSIVSHRVNAHLSLRLLNTWWERDQRIASFNGGNLVSTATRRTTDTWLAFVDHPVQTNLISQLDALAEFEVGPTRHKLLVTLDRQGYRIDSRQRGRLAVPFAIDAPDYTRPVFTFDPVSYPVLSLDQVQHQTTRGVLVSERAALFDERVLAYAGGRWDEVRVRTARRSQTPAHFNPSTTDATTFQSGLVVRPRAWLSIYGNYAESFTPPQPASNFLRVDGTPLGSQQGSGREAGIKAAPFGGRLSFTLGWFDLQKDNIARPATNDLGQPIPVTGTALQATTSGAQRSRGWEIDAVWRPLDPLQFTLGYGRNDAHWTDLPDQRHLPPGASLLGIRPDGSPKENFGATGRFEFSRGPLRGLSLRVGVRRQAQTVINATSALFRDPTGQLIVLTTPGYTLWDGGVGYRWPSGRCTHRLDLNVRNASDREHYRIRLAELGREFYLSYEVTFR
jgi:iron complex outermembrane receptor protein